MAVEIEEEKLFMYSITTVHITEWIFVGIISSKVG